MKPKTGDFHLSCVMPNRTNGLVACCALALVRLRCGISFTTGCQGFPKTPLDVTMQRLFCQTSAAVFRSNCFFNSSIPGFSSENILSITTPEVLPDFGFRVASPFLEKEPMKAFEYQKSLIESVENEWQFPKRRHRPPPLPVGPPDDNNILLFSSTQAFRIERKVDRLYPKLAKLSALLSSGELAHSPAGWVTLNTLNAYTGRAVPGNFDPQSLCFGSLLLG